MKLGGKISPNVPMITAPRRAPLRPVNSFVSVTSNVPSSVFNTMAASATRMVRPFFIA